MLENFALIKKKINVSIPSTYFVTVPKKFAVDVIQFCEIFKPCKASSVITYQLVKSATSTGANYRAACRARSKNKFFSKICIVVEEAIEITKIMSKAKSSTYTK